MQFSKSPRITPLRKRMQLGSNKLDERFEGSGLQLYTTPPTDDITLEEFEQYAIDRLRVLRIIETAGLKHPRGSSQYRDYVQGQLSKEGLKEFLLRGSPTVSKEMIKYRKKDYISHFILRLEYCRAEQLRKWFINQEVDLFRFRFDNETKENRNKFLKANDLNFTPIADEEKIPISSELIASTYGMTHVTITEMDFYKVPFTSVLDLVQRRDVYLRKGFAYVAQKDLVQIIGTMFRMQLSHALAVTSRALPKLEEDQRLLRVLSGLNNRYVGKSYNGPSNNSSGEVKPEMIDELSKTSFPLCMKIMHDTLMCDHHLKHGGRMQYGLFLKGIGLSLEDALFFWKTEFTKNMSVDKFDKSYAYNIRHNYGKEGKRSNYTPYSCMKIISSVPGPGDAHGCPFKHFDASALAQRMQNLGLGTNGIQEVMQLVSNHSYQLACSKYFELVHGRPPFQDIQHPNQYFEESKNIRSGKLDSNLSSDSKSAK